MTKPFVYLCCPSYGQIERDTAMSILGASNECGQFIRLTASSLLAYGFNYAWCEALNLRKSHGITHFAMIHADIYAGDGWLDKLIAEQQTTKSDVLSVVIPIKNRTGFTSTGIMDVDSKAVTRLSLREVHELPVTFDISATLSPDKALAVNTGLWVCDFTRPWVEKVWFEIQDGIFRIPDGTFQPRSWPEDWNFSLKCHNLGLKVSATRCIKVHHLGQTEYPNYAVFGDGSESPLAGMCLNDEFWKAS